MPAIPTTCCSTIFRSARRRRGPRSRCPTGWRSSTTTSRRRSTSSASTGRWRGSVSAAAASCTPTSIAATWRSATRSSIARISRRSAFRAPPCCRSCPTSRTSIVEPNWLVARDFDDDWTNIVFVGRVIANKKIEDLIRFFHAYHTVFNPRSRLLIVGAQSGFERYLASLHQLARDPRHLSRPLRRPRLRRRARRVLRRRRSVPLRERARRVLRADRRGVLQAGAGPRVRRDGGAGHDGRRRRAVRRPRIRCTWRG